MKTHRLQSQKTTFLTSHVQTLLFFRYWKKADKEIQQAAHRVLVCPLH